MTDLDTRCHVCGKLPHEPHTRATRDAHFRDYVHLGLISSMCEAPAPKKVTVRIPTAIAASIIAEKWPSFDDAEFELREQIGIEMDRQGSRSLTLRLTVETARHLRDKLARLAETSRPTPRSLRTAITRIDEALNS